MMPACVDGLRRPVAKILHFEERLHIFVRRERNQVIDALSAQPEGKTLFKFNFAIGMKYEMSPKLSTRLDGRWRVTDTNITTDSGVWCDPYGYCYGYASSWYNSGELIAGLSYSFR